MQEKWGSEKLNNCEIEFCECLIQIEVIDGLLMDVFCFYLE
jgi:hypothetical protein